MDFRRTFNLSIINTGTWKRSGGLGLSRSISISLGEVNLKKRLASVLAVFLLVYSMVRYALKVNVFVLFSLL